jgi:aminoglycoside phosphotransferase (APT) family kinase protein
LVISLSRPAGEGRGEGLTWAASAVGPGAQVASSSLLAGGSTGSVTALVVEDRAGRRRRLVLKLYRPDPTEPDSAWREAHILDLLSSSDLEVPRVLAIDRDGSQCGWPAVLMTRMPGRLREHPRDLRPYLHDLALLASRIHAVGVRREDLPDYRPWGVDEERRLPEWWTRPDIWSRAVKVFRGPAPRERHTFIHRDYHSANVLWVGRRPSAVVDWLHGCWGPPAVDLAHCRINLWLLLGPQAADGLVAAYRELRPGHPPHHPYWDIVDALSWVPDPAVDGMKRARRFESFVTAAVSRL